MSRSLQQAASVKLQQPCGVLETKWKTTSRSIRQTHEVELSYNVVPFVVSWFRNPLTLCMCVYIYIYLPEPKLILDYVGKTISGNYGAPSCRLGKVFGLILQVELMGTRAFQVRTLPCVIVFIDGVAKGHPTRVCFNIWIWYHQTYYALPCSTNCLSSYFHKEQINIKHIHTYSYVHTHNKIGSTYGVSSILFDKTRSWQCRLRSCC